MQPLCVFYSSWFRNVSTDVAALYVKLLYRHKISGRARRAARFIKFATNVSEHKSIIVTSSKNVTRCNNKSERHGRT